MVYQNLMFIPFYAMFLLFCDIAVCCVFICCFIRVNGLNKSQKQYLNFYFVINFLSASSLS